MQKILFEDTIKYSHDMVAYITNISYNVNLSSMLYSFNLPYVITNSQIVKSCFDFNKLINFENCATIETDKYGRRTIYIHPDVQELANAFHISLLSQSIPEYIKNEKVKEEYEMMFIALCAEIHTFILKRNEIINLNDYSYFKIDTTVDEKELRDMLIRIKCILPTKELFFNDYKKPFKTKKKNHIKVSAIYNYQSFKKELKKFALSETEYIDSCEEFKDIEKQEKKLEQIIAQDPTNKMEINKLNNLKIDKRLLTDIFDDLNENKFFNKETLSLICLNIEREIEKEKALNEFIEKILNYNTEPLIIDY